MSEPDEIKEGWSITGIWCLWSAFVFFSILISGLFARWFWTVTNTKADSSLEENKTAQDS
jgi:hypothetical protein